MTTIINKRRKKTDWFQISLHILLILCSIVFLYPIYYQLVASVSNPGLVVGAGFLLWPKEFTMDVYQMLGTYPQVWTGYLNSIINLVLYVGCTLVTNIGAAYAMSRKALWGRKVVMLFFITPMFLQGGLVPMFITVKNFGLYNSRWSLILPYLVFVWYLLMARAFMEENIKEELWEAAIIDGAGEFTFYFRIVLPLSKAIMAVMMLYYGSNIWNSYFNEMIYLKDRSLYTLQLILREMLLEEQMAQTGGESAYLWKMSVRYAVSIIAILPLLVIFPFVQRYFVKGVMVGSLKG